MTWVFEVDCITGTMPDHASARLAAADVLRRMYLAARRDGQEWPGYRATIREVHGNGVEQATIAGCRGKRQPSVRWR